MWNWLRSLFGQKAAPVAVRGGQWSGTQFIDSYKRNRNPTPNEIMAELKGVAWACASLNATVCASKPPRLYVVTRQNDPRPRVRTRSLSRDRKDYLYSHPTWSSRLKDAASVEEVTEHPLLNVLNQPTPPEVPQGSWDLWEATQLYMESLGMAFWYLERGPFGIPRWAWILPAQNMTPRREADSPNLIDYWLYRSGVSEQRFKPTDIIYFRFPDPKDPYLGALSPLRAAYEQVIGLSHFAARSNAVYENDAIPAALISPDEVIGEEERDRLESQWNQKFRRSGAGKVAVAESPMRVGILQHSLADVAALAQAGAGKEHVCNAYHVPVAFFTSSTNLANLQASNIQHAQQAIAPRLTRRDETLNASLVPLYDPSGRLFLATDSPMPPNLEMQLAKTKQDLELGLRSINEVRSEDGLPPVEWGDLPWLPTRWAQTDVPRTVPGGGRGDGFEEDQGR
jgi:HK97 family phage portal protein